MNDDRMGRLISESEAALARAAMMLADMEAREWLVRLPTYDRDGVVIDRLVISEHEAHLSKIRAAFNPQRADRSVDAGTFTRLTVDGVVWMTDTPAETRDHAPVDNAMRSHAGGSMLIVGLGIGMVLNRAIRKWHMRHIDVVDIDQRIIDAVGPHYAALAAEHRVHLRLHRADIHAWHPPRGEHWNVGWFDIWPNINDEDMAEVKRLRDRFRHRLAWSGAWGQAERVAMRRRIASGKWAY